MKKEKLINTPYFHLVDPQELDNLDEFSIWLESILHNPCSIFEQDGEEFIIEIRQLVARIDGLKVEIYPNEHPPPHFHIKSPNFNASFDIANCDLLEGKLAHKDIKKVKYWHKYAKPMLIESWNSTRPYNCVVGAYNVT